MGEAPLEPDDPARKLDELFVAHAQRVLAYAIRRTPSEADAEDVVAETFVIAWRKLDRVPPDALAWLLAVARRVVANQRRGGSRRFALLLRLGRAASSDAPSASTTHAVDGPAMTALHRLRPDDQEILRLVAWDELDHRQIGQVLGITANAVAIRLHRARARFKDELLKDPDAYRTSTEAKGAINGALQERVE